LTIPIRFSLIHHIYLTHREIVTDNFDALYAALKPKGVTVSAMLAKAVAEVLKNHPLVNAAYVEGGGIKYNKDVNVAMAVAIDGGLITPTIIKANELDLFSISRNWKDLVAKAKAKKLTPAEYNSGNNSD
jgi:pyruvate dehydrogenase E2 component (dihydrolipoamide acetyltransferase)